MNVQPVGILFASVIVGAVALVSVAPIANAQIGALAVTEAPTGYNATNGNVPQDEFLVLRERFAKKDAISDGIGPVYNAVSCADCHENPVVGGNSQVLALRAGHVSGDTFVDHPGGSLIQERAIDPSIQERVLNGNEVRAFRASTSLLGLGFVEAIADETLRDIARRQPVQSSGLISGLALDVEISEAPGWGRTGRFGWKGQQASLLSFAGEEYLNSLGITTPMHPIENTSNGKSVAAFDKVPAGHPNDPDGDNDDLESFALFMRSTLAPPRDTALAATPAAQAGAAIFNQIGCGICHVSSITTAPPGTFLNLNVFGRESLVVSEALGNKIIHPYSDFLLHDIGTGDGIVEGAPQTRNEFRTMPLWGLRTRSRYMHDGQSLTLNEAILRHSGESAAPIVFYQFLTTTQRSNLLTFLRSL